MRIPLDWGILTTTDIAGRVTSNGEELRWDCLD
jgi:hypothetical protein